LALLALALVSAGCGEVGRAENCGPIPEAPSYHQYELGKSYRGFPRIEQATPCQKGQGKSVTPGVSGAEGKSTTPTAPIAFKAVVYEERSLTNPDEHWRSLEIQSWPECRRNATSYSHAPLDLALIKPKRYLVHKYPNLPALEFEDGSRVELYDGTTTVVVFAEGAERATEAVDALVRKERKTLKHVPREAWARALDPSLSCRASTRPHERSEKLPPPTPAAMETAFTHGRTTTGNCRRSFIDPINVLWLGAHASVNEAAQQLKMKPGWYDDDDQDLEGLAADHQWAAPCNEEIDTRASSCFACDRDHARFFDLTWGGQRVVLGDAHHDKGVYFNTGCTKWHIPITHIASTFDGAREAIARAWPDRARYAYWGNTRRMPQCDGSTPHSDGYVLEEEP
jgi:hypothetical protein